MKLALSKRCFTSLLAMTRFTGAELEAAAALVSVLRTEADVGQAKAAATLRAAGAGGEQRAGVGLRPALRAQISLPALIAAAQSLRNIAAIAARAANSSAAGGDASGEGDARGEGGAKAGGGGVGKPSADRLARYLTSQGDK